MFLDFWNKTEIAIIVQRFRNCSQLFAAVRSCAQLFATVYNSSQLFATIDALGRHHA